VWLFFTLYFLTLAATSGSSGGTLPQEVTMIVVLNLLVAMAKTYGVILVFLVAFLALWEKRRSFREIFYSVGLRREGSVKSVFWSFALFPLFVVVGLLGMMLSFLTPVQTSGSGGGGQIPLWYLCYMVVEAFFPVAVVEELWARGYMLDRLMPEHPSSLVKALPAMLLSSLLFTLWHLPSYLRMLSVSASWVFGRLAGNVFPMSVVLSVAYVRARNRNIIGLVLVHFLLDSMSIILLLVQNL